MECGGYPVVMKIGRRELIAGAAATLVRSEEKTRMYGLIGKITTKPGQRDAFAEILLQGINAMPGCLSYVVAKDPKDENALWVTEVWDSKASHDASLALPEVKKAIAAGRPMIAGFGEQTITEPIGGFGLK